MGWLSGWTYRKKITITGATGAGTNYQVPLLIGESSGASGYNFHLEGKSASFPSGENTGGDLRFTASDGTTLLDFWVESASGTTPNRLAKIWVEVPADLGSNQDIYCYFGNPSATNASSIVNTSLIPDDINDNSLSNNWSILETTSSCTQTETNNELQLSVPGGGTWQWSGVVYTAFSRAPNDGIRIKFKLKFSDACYAGVFFTPDITNVDADNNSQNSIYAFLSDVSTKYRILCRKNSGTNTELWTEASSLSDNQSYHAWELALTASNALLKIDDVTKFNGAHGLTWGSSSAYVRLETWHDHVRTGYFKSLFVTKYVSPEPAFSSAGALETLNLGAILLMQL